MDVKQIMAVIAALALMIAGLAANAGLAEAADRELSVYYGQDIASAAETLGELTYSEGTEFKDNYVGDTLALRGNDGVVGCIELKPAPEGAEPGRETLCGVSVGMKREDVVALMDGTPMPWEYDEEIAWIVRADKENELNSEMLVVFFDEDGKVNGAWYRASTV